MATLFRQTGPRLFVDRNLLGRNDTQKLTWTPEIRMLDKNERLPGLDPETKLSMGWPFPSTFSPERVWPPMDPLRPTESQKRIANTGNVGYRKSHALIPPYKTGFRTVPPELVDWRSTFYGDPFEELPYMNEKLYYAHPDYSLAGLLYTPKEWLAMQQNVPRSIEESSIGVTISPKVDAWMRWKNTHYIRNWRWTGTKWLALLCAVMFALYFQRGYSRHREAHMRQARQWWDGAYPGTWKYGSWREITKGRSMHGGGWFIVM
eukprot:Hpha_TRINITY_DN15252_c0_g2::TRINITY_DN15252_c0_g2_i1::g.68080::m.68080